jgi:uncharacterized membrane protein
MDDHWLTRPATIKRLWMIFAAVLAATVLVEIWIPNDPHFQVERLFGFYAGYGLVACAVMILGAKALGALLKTRDTYYEERADE